MDEITNKFNNEMVSLAAGNPGALTFLAEFFISPGPTDPSLIGLVYVKLKKYTTLRGTNLYVLYNDLCGRDLDKVVHLFNVCPQNIIEDAASRQDYSGRELVAEYLESYQPQIQ